MRTPSVAASGIIAAKSIFISLSKNINSARPELVEGPFFLSTTPKKNGASTSSAQTEGEAHSRLTPPNDRNHARSEEHTYELHSLMRISYAVFCLKKKKKKKHKHN